MKLLTQADDYGFTKGVTAGIIDAIETGMLRNTGMFTNMPTAIPAAKLVEKYPHVCFGVDFNTVSGPSVTDPKLIPHLVDEKGEFIRSSVRIKDPRFATEEGRREMFPAEEMRLEIRAQYEKFIELTGKQPGYFNGHSIMPEPYVEAIQELAAETGIPYSFDIFEKVGVALPLMGLGDNTATNTKVFDPMIQINKDPEGIFWEHRDELLKYDYVAVVGHTGFVDAALFELTSLSIERARDHQLMTSKRILDWLKENDVEVITYYDLVKAL